VRGGSIPPLAWGLLLAVSLALCWVWTGDALQVGEFGFAVTVVWGVGTLLAGASRRESLHRGPPPPTTEPEAVPTTSLGAVLVGLALAAMLFGFAFGSFLTYFGAGLLIVSMARVGHEVRGERRARRAWSEGRRG
jgi:hypothetical protein